MNARAMALIELLEIEWDKCINTFQENMTKVGTTPPKINFPKPSFKVSNRGFKTMAYAHTPHLKFLKEGENSNKFEVINAGSITIMEFIYDQSEEIKIDTIRHEIAHIISFYFRSRGHDRIWKNVCIIIGAVPKSRCGDKLNFTNAPLRKLQQKHKVYCSCSEHDVTTYIYNKIVNNEDRYSCRKCKGLIETRKYINVKFIKD